jgi:hypothetical protein
MTGRRERNPAQQSPAPCLVVRHLATIVSPANVTRPLLCHTIQRFSLMRSKGPRIELQRQRFANVRAAATRLPVPEVQGPAVARPSMVTSTECDQLASPSDVPL